MLDPAGMRINLRKLLLREASGGHVGAEQDRAGRGRPLIDDEDHGLRPLSRSNVGRPRRAGRRSGDAAANGQSVKRVRLRIHARALDREDRGSLLKRAAARNERRQPAAWTGCVSAAWSSRGSLRPEPRLASPARTHRQKDARAHAQDPMPPWLRRYGRAAAGRDPGTSRSSKSPTASVAAWSAWYFARSARTGPNMRRKRPTILLGELDVGGDRPAQGGGSARPARHRRAELAKALSGDASENPPCW